MTPFKPLPYPHRNRIRTLVYIRCGEPEQLQASADQAILTAIVFDQALTMVAAVVLKCQAFAAKQQVGPP
jgi:hypothetical protein